MPDCSFSKHDTAVVVDFLQHDVVSSKVSMNESMNEWDRCMATERSLLEYNGQALALSADTPAVSSRTTPLNEVRIVNR